MRLLQAKERDEVFTKERDTARRRAMDMTREVADLTKSYNETKEVLDEREKLLLKEHHEFQEGIDDERHRLQDEIASLEHKRDTALEPLYEKERFIARKEEELSEKEEKVSIGEKNLSLREEKASELERACHDALSEITRKEKVLDKKNRELGDRESHFKAFRERTELEFKKGQQRLRDWLEKERGKLRE